MGKTMDGVETSQESDFDWSTALKIVAGDEDLLKAVVEAFLEECPSLIEAAERAIEDSDAATLERIGHVMANAMRTFGVAPAVEAACQLESMGHRNQLNSASDQYAILKKHLDEVISAATVFVGDNESA